MQWISVSERLPHDCSDVLVMVDGPLPRMTVASLLPGGGNVFYEYRYMPVSAVTHWMLLLEPPGGPAMHFDANDSRGADGQRLRDGDPVACIPDKIHLPR